ncbi:MAG: hypothetical protein GY854_30275 [Deltaproteobacteria bacterium]|nr:hypothetical protein [Deltaproteobacteria bacterium]
MTGTNLQLNRNRHTKVPAVVIDPELLAHYQMMGITWGNAPKESIDTRLRSARGMRAKVDYRIKQGMADLQRFVYNRTPPASLDELSPEASVTLAYFLDIPSHLLTRQENDFLDWMIRDIQLGGDVSSLLISQLERGLIGPCSPHLRRLQAERRRLVLERLDAA